MPGPKAPMAPSSPVHLNDCATWPASVRRHIDAAASFIKTAFLLGRGRFYDSGGDTDKALAERDTLAHDLGRARADIERFRRRFKNMDPNKRPHFAQQDRFNILQEVRLRGWSLKKGAEYYVIHHNTLGAWRRDFRNKRNVGAFFGKPVANKIDDTVRWLIHRLRELFPEPEIGTRTIANEIKQAGIEVSRSTVQRTLREEKPKKPAAAQSKGEPEDSTDDAAGKFKPRDILKPEAKNRTWHLDLTVINLLVVKFHLVALLDGFTRRLLALRVYAGTPKARTMVDLVKDAIGAWGQPRFIVTDHGQQFRKQFKQALQSDNEPKLAVVRGRRGDPRFNGKLERLFRTFKLFQRLAFFPFKIEQVQARLDSFRVWYNEHRTHSALGGRRPEQVWKGEKPVERRKVLVRDFAKPQIKVSRQHHDNDPFLPKVVIDVRWPEQLRHAG